MLIRISNATRSGRSYSRFKIPKSEWSRPRFVFETPSRISALGAVEYTQSIFVGRRVSAKLGVLPIASGAFAGYRREVVERVKGFDVGPGEDLDLTLKIRKLGYTVDFAQYATCHTEVPTRWKSLIKQRRRWDGDGPVRHLLRKHGDLTNPLQRHFSLTNFLTFWDSIVFNLMCGLGLLVWLIVMWTYGTLHTEPYVAFTLYASAVAFELLPLIALFYYSKTIKRDAVLMLAAPIMPIYRLMLLFVRIYANIGEIFWRRSYYEPHVPPHVAEATWRY
jgi:poly-beta-1,6-N-acetyl-D-glucosamine synthase